MSLYPNVAREDVIKLAKSSEQPKNPRTDKINNRKMKQTHI